MAIVIPEERIEQLTDVVTRWCESFTPFENGNTSDKLLSCFDPQVKWFDHGFHVLRVGHEAILGLHRAFLHCNQPFKANLKGVFPTQDGAAVEQVWIGRCVNDIVRPDGTVIMKGSGKDFVTHVAFIIKVSDQGKITRIDEYDHRYWDEGKPEDEYITIKGASLRE